MTRVLTAHQTGYLGGWLGLAAKIAVSDLYCHFDVVPMSGTPNDSFEARNRIKTSAGIQWLTVPVRRSRDTPLSEILIANDQPWQRKHWRTIEMAYQKAPYFKTYADRIRAYYEKRWERLSDLNLAMLREFLSILGVEREIVKASDLQLQGTKSDLVLSMCQQLRASSYIFGAKGKDYADVGAFERAGIKVTFQDYQHPTYPQLHGDFIPYLSVLDLILNCGPDSLRVIMEGQ